MRASCQFKHHSVVRRPKLVVGIVVDQMRWDYLYRYADRYGDGSGGGDFGGGILKRPGGDPAGGAPAYGCVLVGLFFRPIAAVLKK
jgi:hypothetical protein